MRILTLLFISLFITACGTTQYLMSTNDGQIITSYGEPELNEETGMYEYEDVDGKEMSIAQEEVVQIIER
ncbi:YgdI/YgdR family lipoprotein [Vibrio astriarenae]|uniref:YgdI/YgdR family lipoprotein n=1 Tax=Vibrio astriarenae TaxID=1481923 RepID=UPI0037356CA3